MGVRMRGLGSGCVKLLLTLVSIILLTTIVRAQPVPPLSLRNGTTSRMGPAPAKQVSAQAGNITQLMINATVITKTWQGYYGNISGKILLANTNNYSLYDWEIVTPKGEVFAVNDTITDWSNIKCFDFNAAAPELNLSALEAALGCSGAPDCVNATFKEKNHPEFWVGSRRFNSNSCSSTKTKSGGADSFYEVLLLEPSKNLVVYTSIINSAKIGFDGKPTDFQMLVGVNGHGDKAGQSMSYYFYVELY